MSKSSGSGPAAVLVIIGLVAYFGFNVGRGGNDDDYIPYRLTGMDAYVYDEDANIEHFAGRAQGKYSDRGDLLGACHSNARSLAAARQLRDWSYVCCTVTEESSCATKVR